MPVKVAVVSARFSSTRRRSRFPSGGAGQRSAPRPTNFGSDVTKSAVTRRSTRTPWRSPEDQRRAALDPPLAALGLGVHLAVDELPAVLLVLARDHAAAGDRLARPGDLGEAHLEAAHVAGACVLDEHLAEKAHAQHALREHALVSRLLR